MEQYNLKKPSELLKKLVSIESISGNEANLASFLFDFLKQNNKFNVTRYGKNVICKIKGKNSKNCIILNAHIDTVDFGDPNKWTVDFFGGDSTNEMIYGLGAIDDKASVAAMITTIQQLDLDADIILMLVREEEIDGVGTKEILEEFNRKETLKNYQKIFAVVGEPTKSESIKFGHRGTIFAEVEFNGDSGHGSRPQDIKVSALKNSAEFILQVDALNNYVKLNFSNADLGFPSICITNIEAKSGSPNKIADTSNLTLDIRTTAELEKADYRKVVSKFIDTMKFKINEISYTPVGYTSTDSELIQSLKKLNKEFSVADFASDMSWFSYFGIDCVIFGPGDATLIHKPDECISVVELEKGVEGYMKLLGTIDGI
jgi:acetylornithine deacetylase/succinyl-diaminopimelate desuccinylase-like protein